MKSHRKIFFELPRDKGTFQRRTERLDWKKIASIDIDNIIQNGDARLLEELISPVTFCRADTEFDHDKIDPGFIKVFRLSQLISECLLASHEKCTERLTTIEKEKEKLSEEILHLRETVASAKKELKKRKEMLASSQNEMLGQNNSDEYDQCPYCSKRFLTSGYLLAHIQRRHQGLPINPLYPSLPHAASLLHPHRQAIVNPNPAAQPPSANGSHESFVSRSPQQILPQNHQQPFLHTPASSMLYGANQLVQHNTSFSGSVTSLNQIPSNPNNQPINNSDILWRRDSFTQTTIPENAIDPNILVLNMVEKYLEQKAASVSKQNLEEDRQPSPSDKTFSDSLCQQKNAAVLYKEALLIENVQPPSLISSSSTIPPAGLAERICGSHTDLGGVRSSKSQDGIVEAAQMDVIRLQNEFESQWQNLEEKVRQSGIEELKGAMISDVTKIQGFPINSSKKNQREEGEVPTKSPAVDHSQQRASGPFERHDEIQELKISLHAAVQDELKSLVSRLESQEHFWQEKLACVQQEHEKQIQQLRQELLFQHGRSSSNGDTTTKNNANPTKEVNQVLEQANEDVIMDDKSQQFSDEEEENKENVPSQGIIMVGPKGHHKPKSLNQHCTGGAPRDTLGENSSAPIPVAKPRKGKASLQVYSSGGEDVSSAAPSPISTTEVQQMLSLQSGFQQQPHGSRKGTAEIELKSLSESEPEYLKIIQSEEFHERKHDNSILNPGTMIVTNNNNNTKSKQSSFCTPVISTPTSAVAAGMNKSGATRGEGEVAELNSDEVSDYTLSESMDDEEGDDEQSNVRSARFQKNDSQQHQSHPESISHRRGKSSSKQTPVKKKYIFDAQARKIVEVSPDDDENDDDEQSGTGDLNNDDNDSRKTRKSQMDLVRAKTIMELEQQMTDIGLNPESTAIGLEEMGRALKHLKLQRRASGDQMHNYEKFEEERAAVKTLAKFQATQSSIDGKLDAISTLSTKNTSQSSLVKMFKTAGIKFRKRVASAVKKKSKPEDADEQEKVSTKKPSSAPALKTTFFSRARWGRKKKLDGAKKSEEKLEGEEIEENSSDVSTEESSEEIELPPFMTRSKPILPRRRNSSRSSERPNASIRRSRRSRSTSQPKSAKALKRLNNNNNNGNNSVPASSSAATAVIAVKTGASSLKDPFNKDSNNSNTDNITSNSSASSPFSNVDDERESMYDNNDHDDNEKVEGLGDKHASNQRQGQGSHGHNTGLLESSSYKKSEKAVINELKAKLNTKTDKAKKFGNDDAESRQYLQTGIAGKGKTSSGSDDEEESQAENWDDEEEEDEGDSASFAISGKKQDSRTKARPAEFNNSKHNENHWDDDKDEHQDTSLHSRNASIITGSKLVGGGESNRWTEKQVEYGGSTPSWTKISENRLQEIKQMIRRNKRDIGGNTSSSDQDDSDDFEETNERRGNARVEKVKEIGENHRGERSSEQPVRSTYQQRPKTAGRDERHKDDSDEFSDDENDVNAILQETRINTKDNANSRHDLQHGRFGGNGDSGGRIIRTKTGFLETHSSKPMLNSSEEIEEDVRELLNATMSEDDEKYSKPRNNNAIPHSTSSGFKNFRKTNVSTMQPTHHNRFIDYSGTGSQPGRVVGQRKVQGVDDRARNSPSNNSWDSQK